MDITSCNKSLGYLKSKENNPETDIVGFTPLRKQKGIVISLLSFYRKIHQQRDLLSISQLYHIMSGIKH